MWHRDKFLVNKTNRRTEFQIYCYYDSTRFGQPFRPSSGVLSRTLAFVRFMQFWWPFATRNKMEEFQPVPGSKKWSSKLHKTYQCRCMTKNSWWWAERLPETCSRNTNKFGIQCICWFYSQGICCLLLTYMSLFSVAMAIQQWVPFTLLLLRYKTFCNTVNNINILFNVKFSLSP